MDDYQDPKYFIVFCRLRRLELLKERENHLRRFKQLLDLLKHSTMIRKWTEKLHKDKLLSIKADEDRNYIETRFLKESGFFYSHTSINEYLKDIMNDESIMRKRLENESATL